MGVVEENGQVGVAWLLDRSGLLTGLRVNLRLLGRRLAYARLDGPVASSRDPSITGQLLVQNLVTRRERGGQHAPEGGVT